MIPKTRLTQICRSVSLPGGAFAFEVDNAVSYLAPGDLPDSSVFVYAVGTVTDPKSDTFLRICNVQDLTALPQGRDYAIRYNQPTYRISGLTLRYSDVVTAIAAKQLIQARVDQLITDWKLYTTQFVSPNYVEFPLYDASIVTAKKTAYALAKGAKQQADAAASKAAADVAAAQKAATDAADKLALYSALTSECEQVLARLNAISQAEVAFRDQSVSFLSSVRAITISTAEAATSLAASVRALQTTANTVYAPAVAAELTALQQPLNALITQLATQACPSKAAARDAAALALKTANDALAKAQQALVKTAASASAAQLAQEAALAELLAVCPTIDLASV